ncbi:EamA family transporter [Paenibacillus athensensis]|uniref:EamA domain-containing protein n=1 Tax=Paenibacillus athensensis TaxID=1967502 RepID=A0A4Y8Q8C7_9BACL|nr:DMT family transporter [Paenibacillus athensensis]MCD1260323.1 EamA family transporter [Paenibacillus athensensis]
MHTDQRSFGLLWVSLGASMWGTDAILRTPLLGTFSSAEIVLLEHLILCLFAVPFFILHRRSFARLRVREGLLLLLIAWGSSGLATWLFTQAFRFGNPSVVILLQKLQPLAAIVLARLLLKERFTRSQAWVLGLALAGAYLLSFGWSVPFASATAAQWQGSLLALGAAGLWGAGTVLGRRLLDRLTFLELTSARFGLAVPFLLLLQLVQDRRPLRLEALDTQSLAYLMLLALVPGLIGILLYYRGLRGSKAGYATVAELAFPVTALLLNWLVLGQSITLSQSLGAVLIFGCVLTLTAERSAAPQAGKLPLAADS